MQLKQTGKVKLTPQGWDKLNSKITELISDPKAVKIITSIAVDIGVAPRTFRTMMKKEAAYSTNLITL